MNRFVLRLNPEQLQGLRAYLFQNALEQAAFLFARVTVDGGVTVFTVETIYCVPPDGWAHQGRYRLELDDAERARVMASARKSGLALVDCHSHPGTKLPVEFSPSDVYGITEFAPYVHWKLDRRPYVATVWAKRSVDGVVWLADAREATQLAGVEVIGQPEHWRECTGSWFARAGDEGDD